MLRNKKLIISIGALVFVGSAYTTFHLFNKKASSCETQFPNHHSREETRDIYNKISSKYDSKVNFDEHLIGVNRLREKVFRSYVKGPYVLEVAAGTGRNLDIILERLVPDKQIDRIDITDYSDQMLQQAYIKFAKWQHKKEKQGKRIPDKINFKLVDAHDLSKELPTKYYDTVIDTYGMCSFEDPEMVLREMVKVCKPNGRIILLEHGKAEENRAWIPFIRTRINHYLDRRAPERAQRWGCWWNRDIDSIVNKCQDVLEVEERKYYQLGTCYLIVARPKYLQETPKIAAQEEHCLLPGIRMNTPASTSTK